MPSKNVKSAASINTTSSGVEIAHASLTVDEARALNLPSPTSLQDFKAVREYSYGRQRAKRAAERARTQDIKAKGSFILPSSHHDRVPPRAHGNVNANAALGNGIGFGLKLGLTAALTRSRVAIIADNVRREKEDEKSMLDILFKEDRMAGVELEYGTIQSAWPSLTTGTCEVKLEDLVRAKKPRKNKG